MTSDQYAPLFGPRLYSGLGSVEGYCPTPYEFTRPTSSEVITSGTPRPPHLSPLFVKYPRSYHHSYN